jgi:hypothetical protein
LGGQGSGGIEEDEVGGGDHLELLASDLLGGELVPGGGLDLGLELPVLAFLLETSTFGL